MFMLTLMIYNFIQLLHWNINLMDLASWLFLSFFISSYENYVAILIKQTFFFLILFLVSNFFFSAATVIVFHRATLILQCMKGKKSNGDERNRCRKFWE